MSRVRAILIGFALCLLAPALAAEPLETEFNDEVFSWYGYAEGIERAKAEGKLIFALVKTDWCPHCKAYRKAFYAPEVTEHAGDFVFVILDRDTEESVTSTIAPDGDYVPRSMILSAEGAVEERLAPNWFGHRYLISGPEAYQLATFLDWVVGQPEFAK